MWSKMARSPPMTITRAALIVAVPWDGHAEILQSLRADLAGKLVVDYSTCAPTRQAALTHGRLLHGVGHVSASISRGPFEARR
jgi:predicted dinucleotide-binding enzyme